MPDIFITFLASFLIWFMFLGLAILWIIDGRIKKEQVLHTFFAMLFVFLISLLIKDLFPTTRPYIAHGMTPETLTTPIDASYPSMHTGIAFALATTILLHDKKIGLVFLVGAFLVAFGRIMAQVHYPIDTFGGALFGILIAWFVSRTHLFGLLKSK